MEEKRPDYIVVSDFHMGEGINPLTGKYSRLEDFFSDEEFSNFLAFLNDEKEKKGKPWHLIINGDLFDFLQVTSLPSHKEASEKGITITKNTSKYGLGTTVEETKWKLEKIIAGHPVFFSALVNFVLNGNRVFITRGNHDVELCYPEVQELFLNRLKEKAAKSASSLSKIDQNIVFLPWFYYEKGILYAEHGNQYDRANSFKYFLNPLLPERFLGKKEKQIDLPVGSFFIRYFLNKVERVSPIADKMKNPASYVNWVLRNRFFESWYLLKSYVPFFLRSLKMYQEFTQEEMKHIREEHLRLLEKIGVQTGLGEKVFKIDSLKEVPISKNKLMLALQLIRNPLKKAAAFVSFVISVLFGWAVFFTYITSLNMSTHSKALILAFINLMILISAISLLVYSLGRGTRKGSIHSLYSPQGDYFLRNRVKDIADIIDVKYITMGHTHQEDIWKVPGKDVWYFNTGTWIPVFSEEDRVFRDERQLTFLKIEDGRAELMKWDDRKRAPVRAIVLEDD